MPPQLEAAKAWRSLVGQIRTEKGVQLQWPPVVTRGCDRALMRRFLYGLFVLVDSLYGDDGLDVRKHVSRGDLPGWSAPPSGPGGTSVCLF